MATVQAGITTLGDDLEDLENDVENMETSNSLQDQRLNNIDNEINIINNEVNIILDDVSDNENYIHGILVLHTICPTFVFVQLFVDVHWIMCFSVVWQRCFNWESIDWWRVWTKSPFFLLLLTDLESDVESLEDTTAGLALQMWNLQRDVLGLDDRVTNLEAGNGGSNDTGKIEMMAIGFSCVVLYIWVFLCCDQQWFVEFFHLNMWNEKLSPL